MGLLNTLQDGDALHRGRRVGHDPERARAEAGQGVGRQTRQVVLCAVPTGVDPCAGWQLIQ